MSAGEVEEVLAFLGNQQETLVAINAPHCPNLGLVRKQAEKQNLTPGHLRGVDMRLAEHELRGVRHFGFADFLTTRDLCGLDADGI